MGYPWIFEWGYTVHAMASTQVANPRASGSRALIFAAQIAFLPTGILTTLLAPMLPLMIARWSLNDTQAGNLFLVQFLSALAGVQLSAVLLARFGYRLAFLSSLLLMACGSATLYVGPAWLGMTSVAAYGLGIGLIVPTDSLLIAEVSSHSATSAVTLLNFFWGFGAVLCSLVVAWAGVHKLIPVFLGAVSLFLVLLALAIRILPFPPATASADRAFVWREIVRSPTFWFFAAVFFLYPGAETAVGGWVGSYVSRLGPQAAKMALVMPAFFYAALTVGRALGTVFLSYIPDRRMLRAGFATGSLGIVLMLWASVLPEVIVGAVITGLSFATLYPITIARLSQRFGVAARSIGAVMFSLAMVGPAVIPWTVGIVSQSTGSLRAGLFLPLAATVILLLVHLRDW